MKDQIVVDDKVGVGRNESVDENGLQDLELDRLDVEADGAYFVNRGRPHCLGKHRAHVR
jgi:hypothetical protein